MAERRILMIAGPNGAGKTTFSREFLPVNCPHFINADLIAAGLSPFAPQRAAMQAGRLMLQGIDAAVEKQLSFAFETTLSGRGYARKIPVWQAMGYHVRLYFLRLETVDIAIERVAERVRQGGHDVPEAVIRRRYISGWTNFRETYMNLVNDWVVFDNTDRKPKPLSRSDEQ